MINLSRLYDAQSRKFADSIGEIFVSVPHLPKNLVEFLVKFSPIFALIGAALSVLAGPLLGVLSVFSVLTFNPFFVLSLLIATAITIISAILLFLAYKPLQTRKSEGWMLLFWANILSVIEVLLSIFFRQFSVGDLIGLAIGFYILYELRPWYGMGKKPVALPEEKKE